MSTDSATAGTTDPATGTGTAPATGTGTAPAPTTGTAQGPQSGQPPTGNGTPEAKPDPALTKAQRDLAKAQERIAELERASMTEAERRDARLAELEAEKATWEMERQNLILRHEAFAAASAAGAMYPDLVVQAISPAAVEWDKAGKPTNLAKVVSDVKGSYPALFRVAPGTADGGAGAGAPQTADMNDMIRRQARRA